MKTLAAVALSLVPSCAWAQEGAEIVGVKDRLWFPAMSGDVRASGDVFEGTTIDVDETFNFGKPELFNDLIAWVNVPLLVIDRISAGYWFGGYRETETVSETFRFGDDQFTVGADLLAKLDMKVFTATLEKFLLAPGTDELGVALGVELGVKYFDLTAAVSSDALSLDEERTLKGPLPIVGGHLIAQITKWLRAEAEVTGIYVAYAGIRGYYAELVAEVAFQPIKQILVGVGYKLVLFNVEDTANDEFDVDLSMGGFFVSAGVKF